MSKKENKNKNRIIIVESPKKAREIQKFLGNEYTVKATVGHFKDLPEKEMGVDLNTFEPKFTIKSRNHKKILSEIKKLAKDGEVFIATDPDREGYAIGYFAYEELKKKAKSIKRVEFYEITKKHIKERLKDAIDFEKSNLGLFNAFLGRRVGDRIVGYILSPKASKEIGGRFSVGRVQSPAVRLIVEREEEIKNFKPQPYYVVSVNLMKGKEIIEAFYEKQRLESKVFAEEIIKNIKDEKFATVIDIRKKEVKQSPKPPFTTSVLQQTASSQFKFSPEKTMLLAQDLFENGLITYHRTDSVRMSEEAISGIRELIKALFGEEYLSSRVRVYKSKNTQADAHEGIRITNFIPWEEQEILLKEKGLSEDHKKLLYLIYQRSVASQMADAVYLRTTVLFDIKNYKFKTTGSIIKFLGYKKIYDIENKDKQVIIPDIKLGEKLEKVKENLAEKFTKPPSRYTEGSLVKKLEELGIGRPSTYATILKTIRERGYVKKEGNTLFPTEEAYHLIEYLNGKYNWVIDYNFTKEMEEFLDKVEENKKDWKEFVKELYERSTSGEVSKVSQKMKNYALDLAKKHGKNIDDILEDYEKLRDFIEKHKDTKPSEKQIQYAKALSEKTGLELSEEVLQDKDKIKKWINRAKKEAMKDYKLSEKQKAILIKHGQEKLLEDTPKALEWLDKFFKQRRRKRK